MSENMNWKDRLREEYDEIGKRINKLAIFIYSDKFEELDIYRQELLVKQLKAMQEYFTILAERVSLEGCY